MSDTGLPHRHYKHGSFCFPPFNFWVPCLGMRGSTKTNSEYPSGNWITALAKKERPKWQTVRAWWDELGKTARGMNVLGVKTHHISHVFAFPQTRTGFHTWKKGADGRYLLFSQWDYHLLALIGIRRSNIRKGVLSTNSACCSGERYRSEQIFHTI